MGALRSVSFVFEVLAILCSGQSLAEAALTAIPAQLGLNPASIHAVIHASYDGSPIESAGTSDLCQIDGTLSTAPEPGAWQRLHCRLGQQPACRKVSPDGIITTIAGDGTAGYSGDGAPAIRASLSGPTSLAVDSAGHIYVAEPGNNSIRILAGPRDASMLRD